MFLEMTELTSTKLAHIGYAVASIEKALKPFYVLGFMSKGDICEDVRRNVRLQSLSDKQGNIIELVEPINDNSPVSELLKQNGPIPYHLCISMSKSEWENSYYALLQENKFFIVDSLSPAPLLNNRDVAFLYSKDIGLVEIVLSDEQ